jgi:hypothetical protein
MRHESLRLALCCSLFFLIANGACAPQSLTGSLSYSGKPKDTRPFGKYLYALCTVSGDKGAGKNEEVPGRCERVVAAPTSDVDLKKIAQSIKVSQVCSFDLSQKNCNPPYPLLTDNDLYLRTGSDSGSLVQLSVASGPATLEEVRQVNGVNVARFHVTGPGSIVIHATAPGNDTYLDASPVDVFLQSLPSSDDAKAAGCAVLPTPSPVETTSLDAPSMVNLMGSPTPFVLAAQSPSVIAIYTTRQPLPVGDKSEIATEEGDVYHSLELQIAALTYRRSGSLGNLSAPTPFTVELQIPHYTALGDLATRLGTLNYSQFTLQDVGRDSVRITATATPDCKTWQAFLDDIKRIEWQLVSNPMYLKLFYLSSSDVATAFTSLASAGGSSAAAPAAGASGGGSAAGAPGASGAGSSGGASPSAGSGAAASAPAAAGASGSAPVAGPAGATAASAPAAAASFTISQPTGSVLQLTSDTTACVAAGLATGSPAACGTTPSGGSAATVAGSSSPAGSAPAGGSSSPAGGAPAAPVTPPAAAPLNMASVAVAAGPVEQTPPDLLVFSDANPGDDAQLVERMRILAQLDLPRPEMIISAWVAQNSSSNQEAVAGFSNRVKTLVADYNDEVEAVVIRGWTAVKEMADNDDFYNHAFRRYVSDLFIADTYKAPDPTKTAQQIAQDYLDHSQVPIAEPVEAGYREAHQICEPNKYCLGYTNIFASHQTKPNLTDLLLVLIAAQDPVESTQAAIDAVEGSNEYHLPWPGDMPAPPINKEEDCRNNHCKAIWRVLSLDQPLRKNTEIKDDHREDIACTATDQIGELNALFYYDKLDPESQDSLHPRPRVYLECFRKAAMVLLASDGDSPPPYPVGLLRATLANFLFNYKISQEYPHEFIPYDLTTSANDLNTALNPLMEAFNRDLLAYQAFVRADLDYYAKQLNSITGPCCVKRLFGLDKPSFYNDGLVSVRTISGQQSTVNTTSQSFLNAGAAPQLSALLSSLAVPGGATSPTIPFLSAHPGAVAQSLAAALAQYQTTTAQIGRMLDLTVTPRSLTTASSAEIEVTLSADDSASGPLYTGGGANDPSMNTSRVAQHDVVTRVRIESAKLFEVSSFTATVERSHSRFPLLPPFVEIPYIGTFAGVPIGPAREFHSSTAIMNAFVVPTAADLAYGLRFQHDLLLDSANPEQCSYLKGASGPTIKNPCVYRNIFSTRDLGLAVPPIKEYNREMMNCLETDTSSEGCSNVTFDNAKNIASY